MTKALRVACKAALLAFALSLGGIAAAQEFPRKPITIVVPIAPGGLTDTIARQFGARLSERLGQPVVIDNRPRGGGVTAMKTAAKLSPDGYSLVIVFTGSAAVTPVLSEPTPYDTLRDFAPVARLAMYPLVMAARAEGVKEAKAFLAEARKHPGALNFVSGGNTTTSRDGIAQA